MAATTILAAGEVLETDCSEQQRLNADKIIKKQIIYHHLDQDTSDYELLSCHYTFIGGKKSLYTFDVRLAQKKCSFSVDVMSMDTTILVKNEIELRKQNKQCKESSTMAEYKKEASEPQLKLIAGNPVVGTSDSNAQATLDQKSYEMGRKQVSNEEIQLIAQKIEKLEKEEVQQINKLAQDIGSTNTIEEVKKNPILLGGFQDCNEEQKNTFLADTLSQMDRPGLFVAKDVTFCQVQVVAGFNVKISFGTDPQKSCHAHIFYPLGDADPEFEIKKVECLPGRTPLIGGSIEEEKCDDFIRNRALKSFKKKAVDPILKKAYKENVVSCLQQFADGTKVHLTLSFNRFTCDYFVFFAPTFEEFTSGKINCRYL